MKEHQGNARHSFADKQDTGHQNRQGAVLPLLALVGRPNVGKSTLFNRLIRASRALTHDRPGITRDRMYAEVTRGEYPYTLVDTGGIVFEDREGFGEAILAQVRAAVAQSHAILFIVDGKQGLLPADEEIAQVLRSYDKPVLLLVNKIDGQEKEEGTHEFYRLGLEFFCVSAAHGYGLAELTDALDELVAPFVRESTTHREQEQGLRIALVGRPNAGKSSLVNALVGQDRLIVSDVAGTTRDSVDVTFVRRDKRYTIVDTAGMRRKTRITDTVEHASVLAAIKSFQKAQVTVLVLDATAGVTLQDKKLISLLDREKVPFITAVNKIDCIAPASLAQVREEFSNELRICPHVPVLQTSAVRRDGLGKLLPLLETLWAECAIKVTTGVLNRTMAEAIERHQPPIVKRRRAKFYYLTQTRTHPPTFIFFVNDPEKVKESYKRFLYNQLRRAFGLSMAPLCILFRSSHGEKK